MNLNGWFRMDYQKECYHFDETHANCFLIAFLLLTPGKKFESYFYQFLDV